MKVDKNAFFYRLVSPGGFFRVNMSHLQFETEFILLKSKSDVIYYFELDAHAPWSALVEFFVFRIPSS